MTVHIRAFKYDIFFASKLKVLPDKFNKYRKKSGLKTLQITLVYEVGFNSWFSRVFVCKNPMFTIQDLNFEKKTHEF